MPTERPKNNFGTAVFLSAFFGLATGIFLLILGKSGTFQLVNGNHNIYADYFFKYYTYAGDGIMWVVLGLFCIVFRKQYIIVAIAGLIISTLLSQFLKRVVFPDDLRPVIFLSDNFPVHLVEGVTMKRLHSFPSGHTSAAFTMALIVAHMTNKKAWSVILPVMAFFVGYSRVYLAQHFPTDVFAGIWIGIFSAVIALLWKKKILRKET